MAENENSKALLNVLWAGADILRGKMDANEYKNYLLGIVFYKYLSDTFLTHVYDLLNDEVPENMTVAQQAYEKIYETEDAEELLEEVKESIINAYETKSHLSRNKIAKLMSDETWLNAKKAHEMGFVDGILFAEKKKPFPPEEEEEEEPDEDEKKEDALTAMTYSKSKNLSAFLSKVSASAEPVKGTPIDQLEKRLALLKY